jgi:hypothetical protein
VQNVIVPVDRDISPRIPTPIAFGVGYLRRAFVEAPCLWLKPVRTARIAANPAAP